MRLTELVELVIDHKYVDVAVDDDEVVDDWSSKDWDFDRILSVCDAGTICGLSRILFEKKCKDQIQTEVIIANLESREKQTDGKEFVFAIGIIIFRHSLEVTSRATLGMGGCPFGFLISNACWKCVCFFIGKKLEKE